MAVNGGHAGTKKGPNWGHVNFAAFPFSGTSMTGRLGHRTMSLNGRSTVSYLTRTPRVPLFVLVNYRSGSKAGFSLPGATWAHFRCMAEPSPGHIRCRRYVFKLHSGQVRPRQGTDICNFGAPSPLEALHWIFCFFSSSNVQFSKTSP